MYWTNYHSHCRYCDGKGSPEENLLSAIQKGMKAYGFSSHCPVPFENPWSIKMENFDDYLNEIEFLRKKYSGQIEVYKGLEVDFIPGLISPKSKIIDRANLDYSVGSVHFVDQFGEGNYWEIDSTTAKFKKGLTEIYGGDILKATAEYFESIRRMVKEACPNIVGHLDKIKIHNKNEYFFDERADWYKKEAFQTLEEIKGVGAIIEVNTRGMYKKLTDEPYPGAMILKQIREMDIPICLNSDSHHPDEVVSAFAEAVQLLLKIGFKKLKILKNRVWQEVEFDENGLKF